MNQADFDADVLLSLGSELVDVELGTPSLALAFRRAKKTFQQKGNNSYRKDYYSLALDREVRTYQLPAEVYIVVNVIKPTFTFSANDEFSLAAYQQLFGGTGSLVTGDWLAYEYTLQNMELWQRYLGFEADFDFDEHTKKITFPQKPEQDSIPWILECYHDLTDDEYRDVLWIQRWAIAEAKEMLGLAYRKFSQLPGPEGSVSLDGGSLVQEAKEEKRDLLEEILAGTDGAAESSYGIFVG